MDNSGRINNEFRNSSLGEKQLNAIVKKWNGFGIQGKLHILIQGSLIILFFITMEWIADRFEKQILASAQSRAFETADGLINGMNMLMLTGTISIAENRKLLLDKMRQSEGVNELRIIRGKSVVAQFGSGLPEEHVVDEMDREVLETGKTIFKKIEIEGKSPLLRVEVPFIALRNFRRTNCLSCHATPEGGVNGAASVVIDLGKEEAELEEIKHWLFVGQIAIQIFLSVVISWFVRSLVIKNIAEPVKKLQAAMTEISHDYDLSKRADVDETNHDIRQMAWAFNTLVGNLERATERLELFGKMFHASSEAILITDADSKIVAVNPAFTLITGYTPEEVIGKNPSILSSGKQTKEFYQMMWTLINSTGQWQGEIWNRRKTGEIYPEWLSIGVVKSGKGEVINYIALFSDISERKASEQRIEFLAHYDVLTKLPNRALFADRLNLALLYATRNGTKTGLLFLDLDKFKYINDTFGHMAGDQLLQSVAKRLKSCVRESDTVCRQGGDEFMILLPEVLSDDDLENVAKKIMTVMDAPHQVAGQEMVVSFSIGISIFPDDAEEVEAMIKCADDAMYRAKARGRNTYQFY